ncbi:MAG: hypothetical protein GY817_05220, partial [bacterium]|nr:hypothetical protein [bacterium]
MQALPVMFSCDISEAFFKILLHSASTNSVMFLMDFDAKDRVLTASPSPSTNLVTVRALRAVMGVKSSPLYLSLAKHDVADGIKEKDAILAHHLKEYSYVDDCQSGLHAHEIVDSQRTSGALQMIQSNTCDDEECCTSHDIDTTDSPMVPAVPADIQRAERHLLQGPLGQEVTHRLLLRAAQLELALQTAGMPTKGLHSNLSVVVCPHLLNQAVIVYTNMLAKEQTPTKETLLTIPPPVGFVACTDAKWYRPWRAVASDEAPHSSSSLPILQLAGSPPAKAGGGEEGDTDSTTLLGYRWNTTRDFISTDKSPSLNLHPPRRGRRPPWARITEAHDLLRIHGIKKLKHKHALSCAHACFDPLHSVPWVIAMAKYCYRFLILSSPGAAHYETELTDDFVEKHLYYAVEGILKAKKLLAQRRSWRLPLAVDYSTVQIELDTICDGAWGVMSGAAAMCYLLQRYTWEDKQRTAIYLYSATVGLNPLAKVTHQVDAELQGMALAVSLTASALAGLADEGIHLAPRLTSDSQTALSMCCKAAVQLDLGAGLTCSRVQEMFGYANLYYAPGALFADCVDLLTRYDPRLLERIGPEFYSPSFLLPTIDKRATTPVEDMVKVDHLPHLCPKQMIWCQVAESLPPNLLQTSKNHHNGSDLKGFSATGLGALHRKETCVNPCFTCGTADPGNAHIQDKVLLKAAKDKLRMQKGIKINDQTIVKQKKKKYNQTLAAAGLGAFKRHRKRHTARSARSGLVDKRPITDDNPWHELISRRRGYKPAQRVVARIIELFRKRRNVENATDDLPAMDLALRLLFQSERANSYKAAETRRGNQTWRLVEESGILFIQGRAMDPGPPDSPSLLKQEDHLIIPEMQQISYMVPLLSPASALGRAVCQQVHDQFCGESAASAHARSSRYFYHTPSALKYYQELADSCFKCRRLRAQRGTDVIAPMRNIGEDCMIEGNSIMVDVAGHWNCYINPKQVGAVTTRASQRQPRSTVKRWILIGVDMFSHRIEISCLDEMTTDSLTSGLNELMMANGWATKQIALDPGSSLVPAAHRTARHLQEDEDEQAEGADAAVAGDEDVRPEVGAALLDGLRQGGFQIRQPFTQSSWKQAKIESSIRIFKRTFTASLQPGSTPLTVTSFDRCARLSANLLNLRPIVLLPSTAADPEELVSASPTSLRGPAHCQWAPLGAGRDY